MYTLPEVSTATEAGNESCALAAAPRHPKSPPFHCPRPVVTTPCEEILRITLFPMSAM